MCGARNPRLTEAEKVQGSEGVSTALARYVTLASLNSSSGQSGAPATIGLSLACARYATPPPRTAPMTRSRSGTTSNVV
jgi:hypothetical protein